MAIDKALIDRLLTNYKKLEDIIGENGKTAGKFCSPRVLLGKQSAYAAPTTILPRIPP